MAVGNDINLISAYSVFLAQLESIGCMTWHYIAYRNGKIQGKTANDLMRVSLKLPSQQNMTKLLVNDNDKYMSYKNNVHHWTTQYCWKTVIPLILSQFSINIDTIIFKKIMYVWNDCDFSYHEPISAIKYQLQDFSTGQNYTGDDVLRNINNCPHLEISLYHSLCRLAHKSGKISNFSLNSHRKLVVNCDSMAIPIIPILANFFDQMLVIDNRSKCMKNCIQQVLAFQPTHYIAVFTEENFLYSMMHVNNLMN